MVRSLTTVPMLVVAACGVLLSAALPPAGVWPMALALVPLFVLVARSDSVAEAFRLGFAFGLPFFVFYTLWLPMSFAVLLGGFFWVLFPPFVLILASFWGIVTGLSRLLGGRGAFTLALLPAAWVLMEWARSQGYFAFPWGTLGYLWLDTPVAQIADLIGVHGLSIVTTALAALLAVPFLGGSGRSSSRSLGSSGGTTATGVVVSLFLAAVLFSGAWGLGLLRQGAPVPAATETALLVQGNLDPFGRTLGPGAELELQARLTADAVAALETPPGLVIWPEGAVLSGSLDGARGESLRRQVQASSPQSNFIVGARAREEGRAFNSAYSLVDGQVFDRYDKRFLVPFGERWPLIESAAPLYRAVFGLLGLPLLESTSAGREVKPLALPDAPVAAYICYESVFPQVQRQMVRRGAQVLVNITNDAWFARGNGARQHFDMGRMRAIETRRYLLRAGLDGITAVVDPRGRVVRELERGVEGTLVAEYGLSDTLTPYVRFGQLLSPLLLAYLVLVAAGRALRP